MVGSTTRRWATALFLLLAPGVGGTAVAVWHGCAMPQAPVVVADDQHAAHQHGESGQSAPHQHPAGTICTCPAMVGIQVAAVTAPTGWQPAAPIAPEAAAWPLVEWVDLADGIHKRLPPATAPPHA